MIADSGDAEVRQLSQVATGLAAEFPDVPQEVLVGLTRQAAERYEAATVKTFLPILLTKDVRTMLLAGAYLPEVPAQAGPAPVFRLAVGPPI